MPERSGAATAQDLDPDGRGKGRPRWPPSPKTQIIMLVAGIVMFNCALLAIFVVAFLLNSR